MIHKCMVESLIFQRINYLNLKCFHFFSQVAVVTHAPQRRCADALARGVQARTADMKIFSLRGTLFKTKLVFRFF